MNGEIIPWGISTRYLGVYFLTGSECKFDFSEIKGKFYRSVNSIFGKIGGMQNTNVVLSLLSSFSAPILLYGMDAINVNKKSLNSLNNAYNKMFFKVFKTYDKNIVNECLYYFGYRPFWCEVDYRKILFFRKLISSSNIVISILFNMSGHLDLFKLYNKIWTLFSISASVT